MDKYVRRVWDTPRLAEQADKIVDQYTYGMERTDNLQEMLDVFDAVKHSLAFIRTKNPKEADSLRQEK